MEEFLFCRKRMPGCGYTWYTIRSAFQGGPQQYISNMKEQPTQAYTTKLIGYFLPECLNCNPIVASSCVYAFQLFSCVCIPVQ